MIAPASVICSISRRRWLYTATSQSLPCTNACTLVHAKGYRYYTDIYDNRIKNPPKPCMASGMMAKPH